MELAATSSTSREHALRGILFILAGGLFSASMGAMAKAASPTIPTFELVAARSLFTLIVIDVMRRRTGAALVFSHKAVLMSRSVGGFLAIACYFYALKWIPLGDAVLLNNASPVLTSLAAVWLLGEHLSATKIVAMVASLGGVWLLVHDKTGEMESRGALIGVLSAVVAAWALVSLKIATRYNRSVIVVWCLALVSLVGSLAVGAVMQDWLWPNGREWALLVGTGVLAAFAQLLSTMGYRLLDASEASIYSFSSPVFAVTLGAVMFREWPGPSTWLGGGLILGAGAAVAWSQRRPAGIG